MEWKEPKTDWTAAERMNYEDYNRIKENLEIIWEKSCEIYGYFAVDDMGKNIESNEEGWKVRYFNAFEANIDTINRNIFTMDYGRRQTFYENGPFIGWSELNRIEGAILGMKRVIDGVKAGRVRLAFRLGGPKGIMA